jgi:hypothetical protein
MKWMMSILAAVLVTAWVAIAAQSGGSMNQDKNMDGQAKMGGMEVTYTGCIEAAGAGKFALAHAVEATDRMAAKSMKEPSTKKNEMATDTMKNDNMMSTTLALSSTAIDLSKHLGQKVSVTGSLAPQMTSVGKGTMAKEPAAFTAKSLKAVSGSCS